MQTWLDLAAAALQRAGAGVDLENQADCKQDLEEIAAQERNFTAGLQDLGTLDPLLADFVEAGAMAELRGKSEAMRRKNTEVKQQLEAYKEELRRWVDL